MSSERIRPLFDDGAAPEPLRELVMRARRDAPSQAELDRLAARVAAAVGPAARIVAPAASLLGSPPASVALPAEPLVPGRAERLARLFGSTWTRIAAGVSVLAAIGLGLSSGEESSPSPPAQRAPAVAAPTTSHAAAGEPVAARTARPESFEARPRENERAKRATGRGASATPTREIERAKRATRRATRALEAPARVRAKQRRKASVSVETAPERAARGAAAPPEGDSPAQAAPASVKPSELSLLEQAQAARARGADALSLLTLHENLYPDGALAQEREALAIEVLLRAGRLEDAQARWRRFEAAYPASPHLPRLRALIARSASD